MKIAVASQDLLTISPHPGECRHFWLYSVVAGKVADKSSLHLQHQQTFHHSDPREPHPLAGVTVLIAGGGLGQGLLHRLAKMHIQGLTTSLADPDQAARMFLLGRLPKLDLSSP